MTDRDDLLRAAAEVDALRALLAPSGLAASVTDAPDPADSRDEVAVAAEIARIVGAAPVGVVDRASAGRSTADEAVPDEPGATRPEVARVVPLRPGRSAVRRRWWTAAAGAAAAAVVGIGVVVLPGSAPQSAYASGSPPMLAYPIEPDAVAAGEGERARATLLELAGAARAQVDPEPAGDVQHLISQNYWASTTVGGDGTSTTTIDPVVFESWMSPDGSSVNLEWRGEPLHEDGRLEDVSRAPGDAVVDRLPAGSLDAGAVAALPTGPAALRTALLAPYADLGCGPDGDPAEQPFCLYFALTGVADFSVLPSDLEAAVWTVLADEPGVTVAGTVVDRSGHESVAISVPPSARDIDPTVRMLLVDRETGRLSGREEITLSSTLMDIDEPTVTYFRYVTSAAWVAEVGGPAEDD